jgi:hypothetical protein
MEKGFDMPRLKRRRSIISNGKTKTSIEVFSPEYIHSYKYDEAVADGVVLDLRYEARDIEQIITQQSKIDEYFEAKTRERKILQKLSSRSNPSRSQLLLSSSSTMASSNPFAFPGLPLPCPDAKISSILPLFIALLSDQMLRSLSPVASVMRAFGMPTASRTTLTILFASVSVINICRNLTTAPMTV